MQFTHIDFDNLITASKASAYPPKFFADSRGNSFIYNCNNIYLLNFNGNRQSLFLIKTFNEVLNKDVDPADLVEDSTNQVILMRSLGGIYQFSNVAFSSPKLVFKTMRYDRMWGLDHEGSLWIGDTSGIYRLKLASGTYEKVMAANKELVNFIQNNYIFYVDRTGVLWIGTSGYGILKYVPVKERFHTILPKEIMYKIFKSREGKVVMKDLYEINIGKGGIITVDTILDKKYTGVYSTTSFFHNHTVQDKDGNFWLFYFPTSLLKYDPILKKVTPYLFPYDCKNIMVLDSHDCLWTNTGEYLLKYNIVLHTYNAYNYPIKSDDNDFLEVVQEDSAGIYWLGTKAGLLRFNDNDKTWKYWHHKENDAATLSNDYIISLCDDPINPSKYLWIGTKGGGLNKFDKITGKTTYITTKNGLPNNVIYGILTDKRHNLWLSTNKGLCQYNPVTQSVHNFDVEDGLQGNEFNRYAFCKVNDNMLVFGGMNGLNYFDPDAIKPLDPPSIMLTDLRLFNRSLDFKSQDSPIKEDFSFTKELTLDFEQNMLTLQFAAMDYRKTKSVHYRYLLKGFDRDWINSGTGREATYTNLNPGTYQFIVEGSNSDGVWSSEQLELTIHIIPPWYRTIWFYLLMTATIVSIVYTIYRYRLEQHLQMERVRNRIARDLHDEIGSTLSTISIYSKVVQKQLNDLNHDSQPLLKKISDNANEVQDAMNDIVWSINTKNDEFENIINRMREHAVQLLEAKNYFLHFNFDEALQDVRFQMERRKDFYLVYKEALNNIVKYADGKNVWISVAIQHTHIVLTIKDDGKGFDISEKSKSGNGLQNMQSRSNALKGTIHLISQKGSGTIITLTIPK